MEKNLKIVKVITVTLIVVLLTLITFGGLYIKKNNVWENVVPEFKYGMELNGNRELRFALDTSEEEKSVYIDSEGNVLGFVKEEETDGVSLETTDENEEQTTSENEVNYATEVRTIKANEDEVKTIQNFEKTKQIIQKRLEVENTYEYNIRLDSVTGELILEVPDNEELVSIAKSAVTTKGEFQIIDEQTGIILITKEDIKDITTAVYENNGYQVCLQISFNEEGAEKLKKISNEYRQVVDETGETSITYVSVTIDGQTLITTYFGEELSNGVLQIPLGEPATDNAELQNISNEANRLAKILNEEELPIAYVVSSDILMKSSISENDIMIAEIIFFIAIIVSSIILTIKFKLKGFIASILSIGYISVFTIILKLADATITLNSTIAYIGIIVLNYIFMKKMLLESKKESDKKEIFYSVMKKYYLTIIPVCVIAIVFTFVSNTVISSIGMVLFWGLILQVIYNMFTIRALKLF